MDEFVAWLTDDAASGRIRYRHTDPERTATYGDLSVHPRVEAALDDQGIDRLYRHQTDAIEAVRAGENVVVATPTASGKSLIYTIPATESVLESGARTLYLAPMRALINDQEAALEAFLDGLGFGPPIEVAQYTGQQTRAEKRAIRSEMPHIVLTTPDMLHMGILPYADQLWDWLFDSLDYVVIDEIHEYRGVFGSHVALLLRRLGRVCDRFNSSPTFICCSATIGNPTEHAAAVTGEPTASFSLVDRDTSATGRRHWLFWNPPLKDDAGDGNGPDAGGNRRSPHPESAKLLADLIQRGHQGLVFTGARQTAERYAERTGSMLASRGQGSLADDVGAYQAALTQDRREQLEGRLKNGSLRGVWSTNALELGIDIGSLDAVVLDGYPGTRMETFQRAGRAGRGTDASLVALVGGRDQLDQYLMANPETLFEEPPERAIVNPENEELMPGHLRCAARERWLSTDDEAVFGESYPAMVRTLAERGTLERRSTRAGTRWCDAEADNPHLSVSLRQIEEREIRLVDAARDSTIASLPFSDALRDAHPGAIYYHQGRTFEVDTLDLEHDRGELRETTATHFTKAIREKEVTVDAVRDRTTLEHWGGVTAMLADATIRQRIEAYMRYDGPDDDGIQVPLDEPLPETTLRTATLVLAIPEAIEAAVRDRSDEQGGFIGALHAVEHAIISLFPLEMLCDRRDVGGLSITSHPATDRGTIFVHDGHPGGVGLARGGYAVIDELLERTRDLIAGCPCASGCPACVQSPHCGNANTALEKDLAVALLEELASRGSIDAGPKT